jgi:hypothetical protein
MQGHGSRGGHGGGDPGHRGSGGLFAKKGAGGRPSKAAIAAKTAKSDVTQTRISFGAALVPGGDLKFEGRIELTAPPTFEEAAAVAGREHVVEQQKKSASSLTDSVPDRLAQWAPRAAAGGGGGDGVGAVPRPRLVDYSDSDEDKGAAASSLSSSSSSFSAAAAAAAANKRTRDGDGEVDDDGSESEEMDASGMVARRAHYTPEMKAGVIARAQQFGAHQQADFLAVLHAMQGYEKVTMAMVRRWATESKRPKKLMGRPVDHDAEARIISFLIVRVTTDEEGKPLPDGKVHTLANGCYSRNLILQVAKEVQRDLPAQSPMKHVVFSARWLSGLIHRAKLRYLRVTSKVTGDVPPLEEVREADKRITDFIDAQEISAANIVNIDETNCVPSAAIQYQYVAEGDERAAGPPEAGNSFTIEMGITASGEFLPLFIVIKNTVEAPDARSSTVITNLAKDPLFSPARGWITGIWTGELEMVDKKTQALKKVLWARPYLKHAVTGHVITAQHKAWMDSAGMVMYFELVLVPWQQRRGKPVLIVSDNCAVHKAWPVQQRFVASGGRITMMHFAPNITPWKQPLDIVVNASVKKRLQALRIQETFSDLLAFKEELAKNPRARFKPKAVPLTKALDWLAQVHMSYNEDHNMKAAITRTFIKVGFLRDIHGHYHLWTGAGVAPLCDSDMGAAFKNIMPADAVGNIGDLVAPMVFDLSREHADRDADADGTYV